MTATEHTTEPIVGLQRVHCRVGDDGVAEVQLDRPDKLNAVDGRTLADLLAIATELKSDDRLRAVVLSGRGRSFCAGLDLSVMSTLSDGTRSSSWAAAPDGGAERGLSPAQRMIWEWMTLPVPVIAAVHGSAFGAGFQIALAADVMVVAPDAKLGMFEVRWGLTPDMLGTYSLPRRVGSSKSLELTCTGRVVTGAEALNIGLVGQVDADPRTAALALAREIAQRSPDAVRSAKALLMIHDDAALSSTALAEQDAMARLMGSPNQVETIRAAADKRDPIFVAPSAKTP